MVTRLIIVEGLPGSGKSTIAQIIDEILNENEIEHQLFYEGNLAHPADYDGVSFLNHQEFNELISKNKNYSEFINIHAVKKGNNFFIPYAKLKKELGTQFPDVLLNSIAEYDIYELPLDIHIELLLERWSYFVESVLKDNGTHIFECCFIQNPITVSMLRDNSSKEITVNYIKRLAKIITPLNPILLYVDQNNVEGSFLKVIKDRSNEWLEGFIYYYTEREFGKTKKMKGIDGTIEVLNLRKKLEMEIFDLLNMEKFIVDNSLYDYDKTKVEVSNILNKYFNK